MSEEVILDGKLCDVLPDEENGADTPVEDGAAKENAAAENAAEKEGEEESAVENAVDFALLAAEDVKILRAQFAELSALGDITELENHLRYAALRDLGLTPEEAYLATSKKRRQDNRAHLYPTVPKRSAPPVSAMSEGELAAAREIFPTSSDAEIKRLYRRVTKQ